MQVRHRWSATTGMKQEHQGCQLVERVVAGRESSSVAQVRNWVTSGGRRASQQFPCQTRYRKIVARSGHGCKVAEEMRVLGTWWGQNSSDPTWSIWKQQETPPSCKGPSSARHWKCLNIMFTIEESYLREICSVSQSLYWRINLELRGNRHNCHGPLPVSISHGFSHVLILPTKSLLISAFIRGYHPSYKITFSWCECIAPTVAMTKSYMAHIFENEIV